MRIEPFLRLPRRNDDRRDDENALITVEGPRLPSIFLPGSEKTSSTAADAELLELTTDYDVRAITPRQMVELSLALYTGGHVNRDQYQALAFQSELMPNFDNTIGALTGERAEPDRPRDYVEVWHQRLIFETNHYPDNDRITDRTRKILSLLDSMGVGAKRTLNPLARARRPRAETAGQAN